MAKPKIERKKLVLSKSLDDKPKIHTSINSLSTSMSIRAKKSDDAIHKLTDIR